MLFDDIIIKLGIEKYPEGLKDIFYSKDFDTKDTGFADEKHLCSINEKYDVWGKYQTAVTQAARYIANDEHLCSYANLCIKYLDKCGDDVEEARKLYMPTVCENSSVLDLFPLIVLMQHIDKAYNRYISLGIDEKTTMNTILGIGKTFRIKSERFARPLLLKNYFDWLCLYICAKIINTSGFNFEIRKHIYSGVFIKNKTTGVLLALIYNQQMHRSGYVLGTPCFEDQEGSYFAEFSENDEYFTGYEAKDDGTADNKPTNYPKSEWEKVLSPGDDVIAFHIPQNADLSPQNLDTAFAEGARVMKKYFNSSIRCMTCASWLISPQLRHILKGESKIVKFGDRFTRFPQKTAGMDVFNFVFPEGITDYSLLPENTTLEKGLKKLYLEGKRLYAYPGAFLIEEMQNN